MLLYLKLMRTNIVLTFNEIIIPRLFFRYMFPSPPVQQCKIIVKTITLLLTTEFLLFRKLDLPHYSGHPAELDIIQFDRSRSGSKVISTIKVTLQLCRSINVAQGMYLKNTVRMKIRRFMQGTCLIKPQGVLLHQSYHVHLFYLIH